MMSEPLLIGVMTPDAMEALADQLRGQFDRFLARPPIAIVGAAQPAGAPTPLQPVAEGARS